MSKASIPLFDCRLVLGIVCDFCFIIVLSRLHYMHQLRHTMTYDTDYHTALWRSVRQPFALTSSMQRYHKCNWERIDVDMLGCLICGDIHICHEDKCPVEFTQDASVCVISGMCVRKCNFKQDEYCDRVMPYCFCKQPQSNPKIVNTDHVETFLNEILTSKKSMQAYEIEVKRMHSKLVASISHAIQQAHHTSQTSQTVQNSQCNPDAGVHTVSLHGINIIEILERVHETNNVKTKLLCCYNLALREKVLRDIKQVLRHVLNMCRSQWHVNIKPLEIRIYVVGLVYLMRSGVITHNIQVIPCYPILTYLLPAENLLQSVFGIKSKFITDIENKFKYFFRQIPVKNLIKLGFHETDTTSKHQKHHGQSRHA